MKGGDGLIVVGLGNQPVGQQFLRAIRVHLRQFQGRLRIGEVTLGRMEVGLIDTRIDLRDHLPIRHRRIEVHVQFGDRAGNLAADRDIRDRVELARRGDKLRHVAAGDRGGQVLGRVVLAELHVPNAKPDQHNDPRHQSPSFPRTSFGRIRHR